MALKLPDSAVPMGDFPVAKAVDIDFNDGENLQEKLDNGKLGGDNSTHKTVIFEKNIDMGKYLLLAKITDANYSNNIIKFSCPNYKGVNDAGFKYENDMDIYKFELHFNTGSMRENNGYGVTLKQHGLGLYSYPLNNPQNTSPRLEEAIRLYWDYSKGDIYVFLVDIMTAIPHCVLEYTGSGTLIRNNTFVDDDLYNRRDGLNGTWEDSKWSSISYNKLETPPIYELGGNGGSGSAEGATTYTSLSQLGLTTNATFQDVVDALPEGGSALLGVNNFTNYQTIFPYETGNDQFARVHIVKGLEDGSCMYARWFRKDGSKEAIAIFNIDDNKFSGWQMLKNQQVYTALKELGLDTTATINDIVDAMKNGTTFTYKTDVFDYATEYENLRYATVTIIKQTANRIQIFMTDKDTGNLYIGKMSSLNKVIGWTKVITENSDPYVCTSYKKLTGTEDLFTLPCGHYISEKANTTYNYPLTDSDTVTAHIYVLGHLNVPADNQGYRIILYFDNKGRTYNANEWWGTFGPWNRLDLETRVNELFQSVSSGKTLVANAITGKGVSTATDATFATMANNINRISAYKEETKSLIVTSGTTGTEALKFTFSANVIAVKKIVAPSDSCRIVPQTSKDMLTINGKELVLYVTGTGTWKVTALIEK